MKKAIILRGPPAVGKTGVAEELLKRLQKTNLRTSDDPIVLDHNWQSRYAVDHRYDELTAKQEETVVVVEICCAEPIFNIGNRFWLLDARPGASRNPAEWVGILKEQGRSIFCFLLWASWPTARSRNENRKDKLEIQFCRMLYDFYSLVDWQKFPDKARVTEHRLDMERLDIETAVDEIWNTCGIS